MGYRLYDWECGACGKVFDAMLWVDAGGSPPKVAKHECGRCGRTADARRVVGLVASYMGEKPWHPMVAGGSFDTMGQRPTRRMPMPAESADASSLREHFRSAEWKDAKAQRSEQDRDNAARRRRTELAKQGQQFNLRRSEDRVRGDPTI